MSDFPRVRTDLPRRAQFLLVFVFVLGPVFGGTVSADEMGAAVEALAGELQVHLVDDQAEEDDAARMAAARIDNFRRSLANRFDRQVFGNVGFNACDSLVARLETILQIKVENTARDYGLTDVQTQKLLLAGRGDIKRLVDRLLDSRREFLAERADLDDAVQARALDSVVDLFRNSTSIGPFRDGSLFSKVVSRDLTVEQIEILKTKDEIELRRGRISTRMRGTTVLNDVEFPNSAVVDPRILARTRRLPNLRLLKFENTSITDAGLEHLKELNSLEVLDLARTQINGRGFVHLQGLTALQVLIARGTCFDDDGLAHLKVLTSLTELHLQGTRITDAGLIALNLPNFVNLKEIGLSRTQVTDCGLAQLRSCTKLERLLLIRTQITDAGLANLSGMKNLRQLLLDQTQVTDAGLAVLEQLTSLERIELSDTRVGDAGIAYLRKLHSLNYLNLANTRVTDAGVSELKQALPELKIFR